MAQKTLKVAKKPAGKTTIPSKGSPAKAASHTKPATKTASTKSKSQPTAQAAKTATKTVAGKPKIQTNPASTKTTEKKPLAKIAKIDKKAEVSSKASKRPAVKAVPSKAAAVTPAPVVAVQVKAPVPPVAVKAAPVAARAAAVPGNGHRVLAAAVAKPVPAPVVAKAAVAVAPSPAASAAAAAAAGPKKPVSSRHGFKTNESIVYPAHGVGRIIGIEEQEIAGITLELFVIQFEKDKMILRVPTSKLASVGMRKLAEDDIVKKAMETLKGKARIKRTMWSRRAQEYEAKINSGDLVAIAEVVRDLFRSEAQPEQSYSERQLYEAALDRMAREIAAVDKVDERGAMQRITEVLAKSAKGRRTAEEDAIAAEAAVKAA